MPPRLCTRPTCALLSLCLVQGCERFAFVAILPLFVLFLHQHHGFSKHVALLALGLFQALSYLGALPAGTITDRRLGRLPATLLGCALLTLGYGALTLDCPTLLWPALGVMVVGHNFFKPGISVLTSGLVGVEHREQGFLWLHLATNIGAMAGPLVVEKYHTRDDWRGIFLWAMSAMALGTVLLLCRVRCRGTIPDVVSHRPSGPSSLASEREQVRAVWLICGVALVFWLTAGQAGSSLALFAEAHTQRHLSLGGWSFTIGPGYFASLHSLLVLLLLPPCMWASRHSGRRAPESSIPMKIIWGYVATAAAFALLGVSCLRGGDTGRVSALWLSGCYVLLSVAEVQLAPLGLALVTQLAPPHKISRTIGLWFASVALGNGLTGAAGLLWGRWQNHLYFAILALLSFGAAFLLWTQRRRIDLLLPRTASSLASTI